LVNNDYGMNSGALSVSVGIPSPTNGNSLIAVIGTRGNTDSRVKSITQSGVTNWQRAAQKTNGSGVTTEIWYAAGVNNAGRQVTVTLEQSLRASVVVAEYTGVLLSPGPLDRWSLGNSGSSPNASTGSTTAATQQNYELYIGAIANIDDSVVYSNWTSTFTKVRESSSAGGVAGDRNKTVLFDSLATSMGTPSMSATLTPAKPWAGVIVTFRTVASEASQCPGASGDACLPQACVPDSCVRESCEESIGRWCQNKSPATACTVSTDCRPEWDDGSCNISQTPCDPDLTGQCPTGQVCVPGDRCINLENSAVASPGANPIQPAAPGSLKIIPWTINDKIVGRGRKGIKIAWTAPGGSTVITGFRVYRGTSPDGPFCALLDGGGATPPLPQEVSGLCVGDVPPSERTVDQDAYNQDLSSPYITTGLPALQFYWDRTVANERIYYYRVSQIEGMLETPFEATHQIWGQQLGYDKDTLPPPQGFKAWASQVGNLTDKQGIVLKWCPVCAPNVANPPCAQTASDLPTLTEYRVYRTGRKKGNMRLLARLDPTCLLPNKRCEITRSEIPGGNACVTSGNLPRLDPVTREPSCAKITPMTGTCNNTTGPRCGIVDQTFTCWPQTTALIKPYQYYNNYSYLVTALHQDASGLWTESMPSNENQGWLNYCAIGTNECAPDTMCNPRRDPDGDGEYLICGDEDAQLYSPDADWTPSDEQIADAWVWPASDDGEAPDDLVAPHRTIGQTIPPDPPARFLFYHLDHLGSPRLILDAAGVKVSEHNYLPFGEEKSPQPDPSLNNRGFTGHQRDQETGLDYMVARYYSSSLGRFMAVDPGEDSALEDPQSWNKYAYVRNNPLRSIDPDGTNLWDLFKKLYNYVDQQTGGALSQSLVILGDQPIDPEPAAEAVEAAESLSGAVDATTGAGTNAPKEVVVDAAKHPESAAHIQDAQAAGQPSTLTVDRGGAQGRRQEALGDTPTQPGKDRDEYPPAMFQEGGQGASVRPVSPSDNRGAGACIGNQCRELADGAKVEVKVKEKDKK
jgi:RHS repeat-associated protein